MSHDGFHEKIGAETPVFDVAQTWVLVLKGRKGLILQWGLTASLSADALFSSVSDRSTRQQSNE
jgi:hypothetical protein